jgi:hypothetical protein
LPANYHLTFSRSETNEDKAVELLGQGNNVAVVFAERPATWHGFDVIDGDEHDLRHLDPQADLTPLGFWSTGRNGRVVGLSPKGRKAKKDINGFVVR